MSPASMSPSFGLICVGIVPHFGILLHWRRLFDGGTWDNGKVELLRGTIEGGKYFAMLHADNGDRAFDPKLDAPIVGKTGSPIMMEFTASESADSGDSEVSI